MPRLTFKELRGRRAMKTIADAREFWANIAQENDWYSEPFYVQAWTDTDGNIVDSVSFQGLTADIIIQDEDDLSIPWILADPCDCNAGNTYSHEHGDAAEDRRFCPCCNPNDTDDDDEEES
jgi:hypothetical protein